MSDVLFCKGNACAGIPLPAHTLHRNKSEELVAEAIATAISYLQSVILAETSKSENRVLKFMKIQGLKKFVKSNLKKHNSLVILQNKEYAGCPKTPGVHYLL